MQGTVQKTILHTVWVYAGVILVLPKIECILELEGCNSKTMNSVCVQKQLFPSLLLDSMG